MTSYTLVSASKPQVPNSRNLSLDNSASRIEWLPDFFRGWTPTPAAETLIALAMAVYCIDKLTPRAEEADAWTRRLELDVPSRQESFSAHEFGPALSFLTGDEWSVTQRPETRQLLDLPSSESPQIVPLELDAVSLFSGGLDSLCGVIDILEGQSELRLGLIAHYDGGVATSRQLEIYTRLAEVYGADRVSLHRFWVRPAPLTTGGAYEAIETTTRARSFAFISAALALASSVGPNVPVYVPENGYIALNVPLTHGRVGSLSTRTTHPYYLSLLGDAAKKSSIVNDIVNPYRHKTKGEMLRESRNQELLRELTPKSVSCSHAEVGRWHGRPQGNCGYCFPCIIRQASMHAAGFDPDSYSWDALSDDALIADIGEGRGADLRAVVNAVYANRPDRDIFKNGPIPSERNEHLGVWRRGNQEIRSWLESSASGTLRTLVSRLST